MRGKGRAKNRSASAQKDHPRLCGEKDRTRSMSCGHRGSPPPMRGKEDGMKIRVDLDRITPAYAGKSWQYQRRQISNEDHPRLCGEKQ